MAGFKVTDTEGKIELLKQERGVDIYRVQKIQMTAIGSIILTTLSKKTNEFLW